MEPARSVRKEAHLDQSDQVVNDSIQKVDQMHTMQIYDIADKIAPFLDDESWLNLRQTCWAWAEFFESLCGSIALATKLKRKLNCDLSSLDIHKIDRGNRRFYNAVLRDKLRKTNHKFGIFHTLSESFEREDMLQIFDDFDGEALEALNSGIYDSPPDEILRLLSKEAVIQGIRDGHRCLLFVAIDYGLEYWELYRKVKVPYHCPKYIPHAEFMTKFKRECGRFYWDEMCDECLKIIFEIPLSNIQKESVLATLVRRRSDLLIPFLDLGPLTVNIWLHQKVCLLLGRNHVNLAYDMPAPPVYPLGPLRIGEM